MPAVLNATDDIIRTIIQVEKAFEVGTKWLIIGTLAHQVNYLLWFMFGASEWTLTTADFEKNYGEGINIAFGCSINVGIT